MPRSGTTTGYKRCDGGQQAAGAAHPVYVKRRQEGMQSQQKTCTVVGGLFVVVSIYLLYQMTSSAPDWLYVYPPRAEFVAALTRHASPDRFIVLALVDAAFVDMAVNLYEFSFRPHGIRNFLFVGAGRRVCEVLSNASLPCFHYTDDRDTEVASSYGSPGFIRKMNIRTDMILDALNVGFTVLHTDLDVAFLRNPLPDLEKVMAKADVAALWDSFVYNAGFVAVKPTWASKKIYREMKSITGSSSKVDDQTALNREVTRMNRMYKFNRGFSAVALNTKRYLCGLDYFEKGNRLFGGGKNCSECYVVHNNWIVGFEAKVFRFKEHHMWMYDKDSYYTNSTRLYLTYTNHLVWPDDKRSRAEELEALKAALAVGLILDRVVILPRFHCTGASLGFAARGAGKGGAARNEKDLPKIECPLNGLFKMAPFDAAFGEAYRESTFLEHPLVPGEVRTDRTQPHLLVTNATEKRLVYTGGRHVRQVFPGDAGTGFTDREILELFGNQSSRVLVFHSLYRTVPVFLDPTLKKDFEGRVKGAFHNGKYRQL